MVEEMRGSATAGLALGLVTLMDLLVKKGLLDRQEILDELLKAQSGGGVSGQATQDALQSLIRTVSGLAAGRDPQP